MKEAEYLRLEQMLEQDIALAGIGFLFLCNVARGHGRGLSTAQSRVNCRAWQGDEHSRLR